MCKSKEPRWEGGQSEPEDDNDEDEVKVKDKRGLDEGSDVEKGKVAVGKTSIANIQGKKVTSG